MIHFILASHGTLAKGMYESVKLIAGEIENIHIITAFVDNNDIKGMVSGEMDSIPAEDTVIAVTDILGGSVNNEFMNYLSRKRFYLIAGMNLPLLVQLSLTVGEGDDIDGAIKELVHSPETAPVYCNKMKSSDRAILCKEAERRSMTGFTAGRQKKDSQKKERLL